jgi:hypothetical protein
MLYREVTTTTVKCAILTAVEGEAMVKILPDEILIGNVRTETAQKLLNKKYGSPITILEIYPETHQYEMPVEEFIKVAKVKVSEQD